MSKIALTSNFKVTEVCKHENYILNKETFRTQVTKLVSNSIVHSAHVLKKMREYIMEYIIEAIMMCEVLSGIYGNDLFLIGLNLGVSVKVGKHPSALKVFSDLVLISPLFNFPSSTSLSKNKAKIRLLGT